MTPSICRSPFCSATAMRVRATTMPSVNEGLVSTCVLLNARLIEMQGESKLGGRASINDFNDFLEEVVVDFCETSRRATSLRP